MHILASWGQHINLESEHNFDTCHHKVAVSRHVIYLQMKESLSIISNTMESCLGHLKTFIGLKKQNNELKDATTLCTAEGNCKVIILHTGSSLQATPSHYIIVISSTANYEFIEQLWVHCICWTNQDQNWGTMRTWTALNTVYWSVRSSIYCI